MSCNCIFVEQLKLAQHCQRQNVGALSCWPLCRLCESGFNEKISPTAVHSPPLLACARHPNQLGRTGAVSPPRSGRCLSGRPADPIMLYRCDSEPDSMTMLFTMTQSLLRSLNVRKVVHKTWLKLSTHTLEPHTTKKNTYEHRENLNVVSGTYLFSVGGAASR